MHTFGCSNILLLNSLFPVASSFAFSCADVYSFCLIVLKSLSSCILVLVFAWLLIYIDKRISPSMVGYLLSSDLHLLRDVELYGICG